MYTHLSFIALFAVLFYAGQQGSLAKSIQLKKAEVVTLPNEPIEFTTTIEYIPHISRMKKRADLESALEESAAQAKSDDLEKSLKSDKTSVDQVNNSLNNSFNISNGQVYRDGEKNPNYDLTYTEQINKAVEEEKKREEEINKLVTSTEETIKNNSSSDDERSVNKNDQTIKETSSDNWNAKFDFDEPLKQDDLKNISVNPKSIDIVNNIPDVVSSTTTTTMSIESGKDILDSLTAKDSTNEIRDQTISKNDEINKNGHHNNGTHSSSTSTSAYRFNTLILLSSFISFLIMF